MIQFTPKQLATRVKKWNWKRLFQLGDVQCYRDKRKGSKRGTQTVWVDNRTRWKPMDEEYKQMGHSCFAEVYPFVADKNLVCVICPYCGEIHAHDIRARNGDYTGWHRPNCNHADYFIKSMPE